MYVVWSTQLGADEDDVPEAATLMPDARAHHYWDPTLGVGRAVAGLLGLMDPAWDVWLLYDRHASWKDGIPAPAWWEHQLRGAGLPDSLRLDPDRFARQARLLLERRPRRAFQGRPDGRHVRSPWRRRRPCLSAPGEDQVRWARAKRRAKAPGVIPTSRPKTRVKCAWSAKPAA